MKSLDVVDQSHGVTYRKLDHWSHSGVFGKRLQDFGFNLTRDFTEVDLRIAQVLGPLSLMFNKWSNGKGGIVPLYLEVAERIRQGETDIIIALGDGVNITIDVDLVASTRS